MKIETYYRYSYGNISVFNAALAMLYRMKMKTIGYIKLDKEISKREKWLPFPDLQKGCKFYFKKLGDKKYKKTLFKTHKRILDTKKIKRKEIKCFKKKIGNNTFLYDFSTKKRLGKITYEDKYQIAVI